MNKIRCCCDMEGVFSCLVLYFWQILERFLFNPLNTETYVSVALKLPEQVKSNLIWLPT